MLRDARLYLVELLQASDYLLEVSRRLTLKGYQADQTQRLAAERAFITIGEALAQLSRSHSDLLSQIKDSRQIVGFRNLLVHRYWSTDDEAVWSILITELQPFRDQISALLTRLDAPSFSA